MLHLQTELVNVYFILCSSHLVLTKFQQFNHFDSKTTRNNNQKISSYNTSKKVRLWEAWKEKKYKDVAGSIWKSKKEVREKEGCTKILERKEFTEYAGYKKKCEKEWKYKYLQRSTGGKIKQRRKMKCAGQEKKVHERDESARVLERTKYKICMKMQQEKEIERNYGDVEKSA